MRFGKTYNANPEPVISDPDKPQRKFIRYFKNDQTTFRILQEPEEWQEYWEHWNPGGFPFPCTGDRSTCPGCTSKNEAMVKAQKRVAFNVLEGSYVNVYKFPKTLAEKLYNRAERIGTLKDRDYTITKIKGKNSDGSVRVDYDIEGEEKVPVDTGKLELLDVEELLAAAYEESWGNGNATETQLRVEDAEKPKTQPAPPPFEEPAQKTYSEAELRAMEWTDLRKVIDSEGVQLPDEAVNWGVGQTVDFLLEN